MRLIGCRHFELLLITNVSESNVAEDGPKIYICIQVFGHVYVVPAVVKQYAA